MIKTNNEIKRNFKDSLTKYRKTNGVKSFSLDDFLQNYLGQESKKLNTEYPRIIKVAPSIKEMISGNMEPSRIIRIDSPITYKGKEMWNGIADEKLELHFGYENGDKRYLSEYAIDSKDKAHAFIVGSTGSGKSVTINDIIFSACFLYPPWELNLTMTDAKVTEFMRYGTMHHVPHIRSIAATGDVGYLISVLKQFFEEMMSLNSLFGKVGVRNLHDFRRKTGLTLPRNLLVMDEVIAMFEGAGDKLKHVKKYIEQIGILGRNTGYNMILASQRINSDTKDVVDGSIPIRICLKCNHPSISEAILGNNQGAVGDVGIGKLYVNDNAANQNKNDNKKYRNPNQTDEEFQEHGDFLEKLGKDYDVAIKTQFYNENFLLERDEFMKLCEKRTNPNSLVLGEPSFVHETPDRFAMNFNNEDLENVLVYTVTSKNCYTYFYSFYMSALLDLKAKTIDHVFLVADNGMLGGIIPSNDGFTQVKIKETDSKAWTNYRDGVYCKILILEAEARVFEDTRTDEVSDLFLSKKFPELSTTDIMRSRVHYYLELLKGASFSKVFEIDRLSKSDLETASLIIVTKCILYIKSFGSQYFTSKITKDSIKSQTIHVLGANKINGLGRDSSRTSAAIKKMLMDCYEANMKFILYTTNIEDMTDYNYGVRYLILDGVEGTASRVKCPDYPTTVLEMCGVFLDKTDYDTGSLCFKKLSVD